jgi:hypothetical protein
MHQCIALHPYLVFQIKAQQDQIWPVELKLPPELQHFDPEKKGQQVPSLLGQQSEPLTGWPGDLQEF